MAPTDLAGASFTTLQRICRAGQETLAVADQELLAWARAQGLSPWQAYEAALAAGIWPVSLERNFPVITTGEQLQLWRSRVLVVGLGGLGGFQATLLVRLGVGRLILADGDTFALSNLNRQVFASHQTLGQNKAQVAAQHLRACQPAVELEVITRFLDAASLAQILPHVQVALDALDNLPSRRQLFQAAQQAGIPLVHGAVHGLFGQVTTLLPQDGDGFQAVYGPQPAVAAVPEVLAPTVSLVASLQVQEVMRLLLGRPPAYRGCLALVDGDSGRLEIIPLTWG